MDFWVITVMVLISETTPFNSREKNALQILLYYDEVKICNPLGTKVKCHKLGKYFLKCV